VKHQNDQGRQPRKHQGNKSHKRNDRRQGAKRPAIEAAFGIHAVTSMLKRQPEQIIELKLLENRDDEKIQYIVSSAEQLGLKLSYVERDQLDDLAGEGVHQGVVAICKPLKAYTDSWLMAMLEQTEQPLLVILDGVTDPHNLGACLRTADAAGAHAVIVPKDKSASLNATVRKVACGAAEVMPLVMVTNLARTMKELQQAGIWVIGTAGEADQSLYQSDLKGPVALVMGAEGKGMRRLTREQCDQLVKLPMAGEVSSLNVSVATGVCLYEAVRQRQLSVS